MRLNPTNISIIKRLLIGRNNRPLRSILMRLPAADLASLFSHLNDLEKRKLVSSLFSIRRAPEALLEMPESQLADLLKVLENAMLLELISVSTDSDGSYFLSHVPEEIQLKILSDLPPERASKLRHHLAYPENSAGRLMTEQVFSLSYQLTAAQAMEEIRSRSQHESIYYIYCIDDHHRLIGVVSLRDLVTAAPDTLLDRISKKDVIAVHPTTPSEEVAKLIGRYDFVAIPVVGEKNDLLGLVAVDDILDLVQEQATAQIYASVGLQEDDRVYSSVGRSLKYRLPWMFLNLALAFIVTRVIAVFEETMAHLIVLATLKSVVAGIGGNTAIQTLTVVTRGLATDDFNFISLKRAFFKEAAVSVSIGTILALSSVVLVFILHQNFGVGVILGISLILNSVVAATLGTFVPVGLRKLNMDPAVSSGVLITMSTDIFGFFSFLGIASIALYYFPNL